MSTSPPAVDVLMASRRVNSAKIERQNATRRKTTSDSSSEATTLHNNELINEPINEPDAIRSPIRISCVTAAELNRQRRLRSYRKSVVKTFIVVATFVISWAPFVSLIAIAAVSPATFMAIHPRLRDVMLIFAVSNSCINPIVYGTHESFLSKSCFHLKHFVRRVRARLRR